MNNILHETNIKTTRNNIDTFFVVLIINDRLCQWEIFNTNDTIQDVYTLLKNKYKIEDVIVEIDDFFFSRVSRDKLIDISSENCINLRITTKNRQYKLPSYFNTI